MAGLLRDCKYEDNDAKMGRVDEKKTPCLHMETMEGSESENPQPHEVAKYYAHKWGYIKAYWNVAGSPVLQR